MGRILFQHQKGNKFIIETFKKVTERTGIDQINYHIRKITDIDDYLHDDDFMYINLKNKKVNYFKIELR
jgi:hypothetical protein